MATFTPLGVNYGVSNDTLTRMYNPDAFNAGVNSISPWSGFEDFHNSTVGQLFNQTPTNQIATPVPYRATPNPATPVANNFFSPIGSSAVTDAMNNSTFAPSANGGAPFTAESLAANTQPIDFTPAQQQAVTKLPGNQSGGIFNSIGEGAGGLWDSIGGWQGVEAGLNAATGIFKAYQGMEALDLAQDKFNFQRDAFERNFAMQKDAYDRQVAQVESRKEFLQRGGS